ncbi:MAG TPA: HIT family protein [Acidimicrobiales bacterium]|nr:HIT family protein [Acidimicrobiales bacterium]
MSDCIFCAIVQGRQPSWRVYEDESTYAFFDIDPVSEYHTLIVPKTHYADIFAITEASWLQVARTIKRVVSLFESKLGLRNIQIVNSSGVDAQQDVFHVHFHLIPRASGDGQDMKRTTHPEFRDRFDEMLARLSPDASKQSS